jgi:hypothetical protein
VNATSIRGRVPAAEIIADPKLFLRAIDVWRRSVEFVAVTPAMLAANAMHTFERLPQALTVDLDAMLEAMPERSWSASSARFIFMTDFCGSTLLWNLLRNLPEVVGIGETYVFANLALAKRNLDALPESPGRQRALSDWERALGLALRLISRTERGTQLVVAKEWPLSNYVILDILRAAADTRAIFLYGHPPDYINAVLRQPNRRAMTRKRLSLLSETARWPEIHLAKHNFSDAQVAAAHWFVQQQLFLAAHAAALQLRSLSARLFFADQVLWAHAAATHLGLSAQLEGLRQLHFRLGSHHSKAADIAYTDSDRLAASRLAETRYGDEIAAGVRQIEVWQQKYSIPQMLPLPLPPISSAI